MGIGTSRTDSQKVKYGKFNIRCCVTVHVQNFISEQAWQPFCRHKFQFILYLFVEYALFVTRYSQIMHSSGESENSKYKRKVFNFADT